MEIKSIKSLNLKGKRVFLRADLNIPILNKKILEDYKLQSILPTIKYIQQNGGKVILATHIGRPKAKDFTNFFEENLTTKLLEQWFKDHGLKINFEQDLRKAKILSKANFNEILLLENLRFFNGEKGNKEERERFVDVLKDLADIYINDAFALLHRDDCSVTNLPEQFNDKAFGLLVEKEITALNKLKENIEKPFCIVLGGNKIKSKITLLQNFLEKSEKNRPTNILIAGAISYTFLKAQGFEVGNSIVEHEYIKFAQDFLQQAKEKNITILLPQDHVVVENVKRIRDIDLNNVKTEVFDTKDIPPNCICVDIGPKTIQEFIKIIEKAKTIFTNGSVGIYTIKEFAKGSKAIFQAIAESSAYKVAGGGDCVGAINLYNLANKFDFLSTGGGATLAFLGTKNPLQKLPAVKSMCV